MSVPSTVKSIGAYAFSHTGLKSVNFSGGCDKSKLETVGDYAFANNADLNSFTFPDSVKSAGECVFENCSNLWYVNVSSSMESVPQGFCGNCVSLNTVSFPEAFEGSVADGAFKGIELLQRVYIQGKGAVFPAAGDPFPDAKSITFYGYEMDGSVRTSGYALYARLKNETNAHPYWEWKQLDDPSLAKVTVRFSTTDDNVQGSMPNATAIRGADHVLPENSGFTKSGYAFVGWSVKANGAWLPATMLPGARIDNVVDDVLCYPRFEKSAYWKVTLTDIGGDVVESYKADSVYVVPGPGYTPGDGRIFKNWYCVEEDAYYASGDTMTLDKDVTLRAVWVTPKTVIFEANGGTFADESNSTGYTNKDGKLDEFPAVTREGYDLEGWQVYDSVSRTTSMVDEDTPLAQDRYLTQFPLP